MKARKGQKGLGGDRMKRVNQKHLFFAVISIAFMLMTGCAGVQPRPAGMSQMSELDLRDAEYTYYNDDAQLADRPAAELEKIAAAMALMAEAKKKAAEAEIALAQADQAKARAAAEWLKQERKERDRQAKLEEKKRKDKLKADKDRAKRWRDYNKSVRDTVDTVEHVAKAPLKPFTWLLDKVRK